MVCNIIRSSFLERIWKSAFEEKKKTKEENRIAFFAAVFFKERLREALGPITYYGTRIPYAIVCEAALLVFLVVVGFFFVFLFSMKRRKQRR